MKTYLYVCRCGWTGQVSEADDQACPVCDRDIEVDDTMQAPSCDYCGAPAVIQDRVSELWSCADCLSNQADSLV